MADNQYSKVFGTNTRLTSSFQEIYAPSATGDGKTVVGNLVVTPLDPNNSILLDVMITDASDNMVSMFLDNASYSRGQGEALPMVLADGQKVYARVRSDITALTVSAISQATPAVVTVNSTTGLARPSNSLIYLSGEDTTDLSAGFYRAEYVNSTSFNLKTILDADQANTTDAGTTGTVTIVPGMIAFHAYEQTIPQE